MHNTILTKGTTINASTTKKTVVGRPGTTTSSTTTTTTKLLPLGSTLAQMKTK